MVLPLLDYAPSAQNQRVKGFEGVGEEQARLDGLDINTTIRALYRQIFNEQQLIAHNRQPALESQLRSGKITVREFVRSLAKSDTFRRRNYEVNNNYRFVQLCVQRLLGRDTYHDREKLAWSIVLATRGLDGFVDALVDSDEYQTHFGEAIVPFQRRRILPQRAIGEVTFSHTPRYGADYRDKLPQPLGDQFAPFDWARFVRGANWPVVAGLLLGLAGLATGLLLLTRLS